MEGGGCPAERDAKEMEGDRGDGGKKEKMAADEGRLVGIYVWAKQRGAAPGARSLIGGTLNPARPTPTTK